MGSRFDVWVYWHLFTITVNCLSSHIELILNAVCQMTPEESLISRILDLGL
jgi:hypothetical protein